MLTFFSVVAVVLLCLFFNVKSKKQVHTATPKAALTFEDLKKKVFLSDGSLCLDNYANLVPDLVGGSVEFADGALEEFLSLVASTTTYSIKGWTGLSTFASMGHSADYTVLLKNNIDCLGNSLSIGNKTDYFQGTFDGCGYTISNFTIAGSGSQADNGSKAQSYGLFAKISGTIQNLKIDKVAGSFVANNPIQAGGLIGYALGATITNCAVSNLSISKNGGNESLYAAPIFCVGWANVSDCYVENFSATGCQETASIGPACDDTFIYTANGYGFGYYYYSGSSEASTIDKCVIKDSSSQQIATDSDVVFLSYGDSKTPVHSVKNCHTTAKTTTGLDVSHTGGPKGTLWYYSDYRDGWPQLRQFITNGVKWKTVPIVAGAGANVDKNYIQLPRDANNVYYSDTETITIYNQEIKCWRQSGYCPHGKVKWTYVEVTDAYWASYDRPDRTYQIYSSNSSTLLHKETKRCCETIKVTYESYNKGVKTITIGGYKYYAPQTHYITNVEEIKSCVQPLTDDKNITIQLAIKKYDISIV